MGLGVLGFGMQTFSHLYLVLMAQVVLALLAQLLSQLGVKAAMVKEHGIEDE
jgi:hypothetical protein